MLWGICCLSGWEILVQYAFFKLYLEKISLCLFWLVWRSTVLQVWICLNWLNKSFQLRVIELYRALIFVTSLLIFPYTHFKLLMGPNKMFIFSNFYFLMMCILGFQHHCRRCGGLFCNSCTQQRMFLRGQGDSPVRICEPCKKLEDAARFEMRHGHKSRAGRGIFISGGCWFLSLALNVYPLGHQLHGLA